MASYKRQTRSLLAGCILLSIALVFVAQVGHRIHYFTMHQLYSKPLYAICSGICVVLLTTTLFAAALIQFSLAYEHIILLKRGIRTQGTVIRYQEVGPRKKVHSVITFSTPEGPQEHIHPQQLLLGSTVEIQYDPLTTYYVQRAVDITIPRILFSICLGISSLMILTWCILA